MLVFPYLFLFLKSFNQCDMINDVLFTYLFISNLSEHMSQHNLSKRGTWTGIFATLEWRATSQIIREACWPESCLRGQHIFKKCVFT